MARGGVVGFVKLIERPLKPCLRAEVADSSATMAKSVRMAVESNAACMNLSRYHEL